MLPHQQNIDFRKQQIDTLKVYNTNVVAVSEHREYGVHFESGGRNLLLTVYLTPTFPKERPILKITPILQHQWINIETGEIDTAPGILNYSIHSDLGLVVQAIIREFERSPPPTIESSASNFLTTSNMVQAHHCFPNYMSHTNLQIKDDFNLSALSLDELKQLDNDSEFIDDYLEDMTKVETLNETLDTMLIQFHSISREHQGKEKQLVELKERLSENVRVLKELGGKCEILNKIYLKKFEDFSPQHIRELLQIAVSTADAESEKHVELFLNGNTDIKTFLSNYQDAKKISSARKVKEERLGQQLLALERAGNYRSMQS